MSELSFPSNDRVAGYVMLRPICDELGINHLTAMNVLKHLGIKKYKFIGYGQNLFIRQEDEQPFRDTVSRPKEQ